MYKVKNKLNQRLRYKGIYFKPFEEKVLDEKPYSDKFHVEKTEEIKKSKGGKK